MDDCALYDLLLGKARAIERAIEDLRQEQRAYERLLLELFAGGRPK